MDLDRMTAQLDAFFGIDALPPDSPFRFLVPETYQGTGIRLESHFENSFLERFHGLMMRNGRQVERIYTAVFLSDEIVGKVVPHAGGDAVLICHHPLSMETGARGFLPLSRESLAAARDSSLSVYILHTPLDVHGRVSTSRALARELGMSELGQYAEVPGGYAGVYGRLPDPIRFDALLRRVRLASGVPDPHFICNHETVQTIGVVAGGVGVEDIREAAALRCDAMVTGTYYNLVQNEIGRRYRDEFDAIRDSLEISLIECSHYASEAVVMRQDMVDLCATRFGLPCQFVAQDDPWY
jgi:putative NIF3 family GTP cyclohydrolase 1 type 2